MGCLGNSKTEDQRIDEKAQREANKKIEKQLQKERLAYKATHRLLLLGKEEGGRWRGGREPEWGGAGERRGHLPHPGRAAAERAERREKKKRRQGGVRRRQEAGRLLDGAVTPGARGSSSAPPAAGMHRVEKRCRRWEMLSCPKKKHPEPPA